MVQSTDHVQLETEIHRWCLNVNNGGEILWEEAVCV